MSRRKTTDEERILFRETISETRPLAPFVAPARVKPRSAATAGASGLDGRTDEKLRRGLLDPDARLDLHGFTEREAHNALLLFLRGA
jgi:DNA-nicking Smr family endonuclease